MPEERHLLLQRAGGVGHALELPSLQVVEAAFQVQLLRGEALIKRAVVDAVEVDQVVDRSLQAHLAETGQFGG